MLNIIITMGLFIYIIELGRETDRAISQWALRKVIPIIGGLVIFQLILNAGFFVWTSIIIYQVLFDMQPHTYNQVIQLLIFCMLDIGMDYFINRHLQ